MTDEPRQYWLMKSEPGEYSIDDLERDGKTYWDGVRNYQARNLMRDRMRIGDGVLYYHSNAKPTAVVGLARVCSESYPDPTQFDPDDGHYDPKSDPENPRWYLVDIEFERRFDEPVTLAELRQRHDLEGMALLRRGQRLSVQPVTAREWGIVCEMAGVSGAV